MTSPEMTVSLTVAEALAVCDFFSYGATRGNHAEVGDGPGPLSGQVDNMGSAVNKIRQALNASKVAP